MKTHKWAVIKRKSLAPEQIAEVAAQAREDILEMNLHDLRAAAGKTQVEVAVAAGISQAELSRAEKRDDHLVSTLRRYVEARGGELEVIARFGDKEVKLRGV